MRRGGGGSRHANLYKDAHVYVQGGSLEKRPTGGAMYVVAPRTGRQGGGPPGTTV